MTASSKGTPVPDRNGSTVTRAELSAHIRRLDDNLEGINRRLGVIEDHIGSSSRWVGARVNSIMDKIIPIILVAAATYLLTH